MTQERRHAPAPWWVKNGDEILGTFPGKRYNTILANTTGYKQPREATAEHIVCAVNCHDDLLNACKGVLEWLVTLQETEGISLISETIEGVRAAVDKTEQSKWRVFKP